MKPSVGRCWGEGASDLPTRPRDRAPFAGESALSSLNRWKGRRRAAFWRSLGFPNLVRARDAKAEKRRLRRLKEWKRKELRTPFAILDERRPNYRR